MNVYDNTELFFIKTLEYGIKTWKAQRTRIFNSLNIGNTSSLTRSVQYKILNHIAESSSTKKRLAKELLENFFKDFVEAPVDIKCSELVKKYAKKYNVDEFELQERYRIIKRDMIEKNMHPDFKISVYKFKHTIKLTEIVKEIFVDEGTPLSGEFPKEKAKEIVEIPLVKPKRKYTKRVK